MKYPFVFPMKKYERILGILCIPVHAALLPMLLGLLLVILKMDISPAYQTLICYTVSFIVVLSVMFSYLRASFSDFIGSFWRAVQAVILGYAMYYALSFAALFLLTRVMTEVNPNTQIFIDEISSNYQVMIAVAVVLAPIIEEALFRGALFGSIRNKSRIAAYSISILIFAIYHLWQFLFIGYSTDVLLYIAQYLPAGIALAWCYERGGTIWSPILLHAAINLLSVLAIA